MVPSVFAGFIAGQAAPIAMTTEFTGPPYPVLEAGDRMQIGVTGATAGDLFTVGAFINEITSPAGMAALQGGSTGYIQRPGMGSWQR